MWSGPAERGPEIGALPVEHRVDDARHIDGNIFPVLFCFQGRHRAAFFRYCTGERRDGNEEESNEREADPASPEESSAEKGSETPFLPFQTDRVSNIGHRANGVSLPYITK